jgi:amino acid permease
MVGTGILLIPKGYSDSGLILGIRNSKLILIIFVVVTLLSFFISYYTCYLVIKTAGTDTDYTDTLQKHFGRAGWRIGMTLFIINLFVPIIIYF